MDGPLHQRGRQLVAEAPRGINQYRERRNGGNLRESAFHIKLLWCHYALLLLAYAATDKMYAQ